VRPLPILPAQEKDGLTWRRDFDARAVEAIRAVPGVISVAGLAGSYLPLYRGSNTTARISAPGSNAPAIAADMRRVTSEYFAAARTPLLRGRAFTDAERGERVLVIDAEAARQLFGSTDAVGRRIALPGVGDHIVVGVAANVRLLGPEGATQPQIYKPIDGDASLQVLVIRTSRPAAEMVPAIEGSLAALMPPKSPRPTVEVVDDQYRVLTADRRFNASMMSALGLLALVIGMAGIYASTATMVAQRTKEIGIRMALGATAARVVQSVTATVARLLAAGTLIGLAGAWMVSHILRSVVFGMEATDLVAYAVPAVLIVAGGVLAAMLPARRAARIDPLITLRSE
jgi:ABC-type antimicrobial peptide transport system permease subunit